MIKIINCILSSQGRKCLKLKKPNNVVNDMCTLPFTVQHVQWNQCYKQKAN